MRIIEKSKRQLEDQLPFAIYRKPNSQWVQGFFQKDNTLFATRKFVTSGFVFAPFDTNSPSYIIPSSASEILREEFDLHNYEGSDIDLKETGTSKDQHINLVKKGIEAIENSNLKKVVLSREEEVFNAKMDPIQSFIKLCSTYSNAFVYLWYHPKESTWLGATPETLISIHENSFQTIALASTQKYNGTLEVEWGDKEKQEHQFVVDYIQDQLLSSELILNDLKISDTYTIKAGKLLHLRADITGNVDESQLKNLIQVLHPTPAVCGLPKEDAKDFILQNEGYNREFYTGFLGEILLDKSSELFVNLRCMQIKDHGLKIYVGGGITSDSDPEKEWKETVFKTGTIKKII